MVPARVLPNVVVRSIWYFTYFDWLLCLVFSSNLQTTETNIGQRNFSTHMLLLTTNLTTIVVSEYYIASCNCLKVATTLLHFLRAPCTRGWNLYVIRRIKLVEWWSTCCKSLVNNFNDKLIDLIYFICTLLVADHSARAYLTTNQVLMALPLLSMSLTLPTSTSKF